MSYRKIPLGRYLKVARNPSMTFKELFDIMYTKDVVDDVKGWVEYTLDIIHEIDVYIIHSPIDGCYCNRYVKDYNSAKEMEEELKVKPLCLKHLGEL